MSERFHEAVQHVLAERFLQEKRASARSVDSVTLANFMRTAESVEDPELFKLAAFYSPGNTMEAYASMGGKVKVAEPPPPKGVSVKAWDKILSEGPKKPVSTVIDS